MSISKRNKSSGGIYNTGVKFVELGEALQDKRTGLDELSDLAFACGLRLKFCLEAITDNEVVKPRTDDTP